ncbi:MAG: glucose-1-phosphate adenylyltransferase subunit GlgD [Acutalibacteraceae bacterium]|nr:glucose-1-phosphate adenylyltransferase subunit GlgD [Acutalibacteraceae bacterium]
MNTNKTLGIVFANSHDALLGKLTKQRSMGSLPFGGRYRLIDFALSNLSNAGIDKVGVITKANYHSLMTHVGNGKPWDLDRKNGGLSILPPYASPDAQVYKGRLEAIYGILEYLLESNEENVVLCDSDVVANINVKKLLSYHKEKDADVTVVYTRGDKPEGQNDMLDFKFDSCGRIVAVNLEENMNCDYSLDVMVIGRELLIDIVVSEINAGRVSLSHGIFSKGYNKYKIYGFEHKGFSAVMDSPENYFKANLALLDSSVRDDVFSRKNPIYTKTRDDMPAKYGISAKAKNAIIADGCIIEGTVKNSVLFRGVKVAKGAIIENCVLMEGTTVGKDSIVRNVITDRFVKITDNQAVDGKKDKTQTYIEKNSVI